MNRMNRVASDMEISGAARMRGHYCEVCNARVAFASMRTVEQWLGEYGASHTHARNELLHIICVPAIVMTVIGFFWAIPVPQNFAAISPWLNWATFAVAAAVVYYLTLSPPLGAGAAIGLAMLLCLVSWLDTLSWPLWLTCLVIFIVAWIGQFIGHSIEGTRPSFFKDVQFLLIGPIWLLSHLYRRLGLSY
jgi:uncharacterized membrane protein YGL010W